MDLRGANKPKGTTLSKKTTNQHATLTDTPTYNEDGTLAEAPEGIAGNMLLNEYWTYLKDHDITKDDLRAILDSLITSGNVVWDFKLFDKIDVKFQVRTSWIDDCILEKLDDLTARNEKVSTLRYNNMIAELNLAASLRQFGESKFDVKTKDDLNKSIEFVQKMTYIFRNQLVQKLAVFDRAVALATSEWSLKNFTTPLTGE